MDNNKNAQPLPIKIDKLQPYIYNKGKNLFANWVLVVIVDFYRYYDC
jgi:hypothetical protein